jgi:D-alanyl-D-alanine carboxypeptidase
MAKFYAIQNLEEARAFLESSCGKQLQKLLEILLTLEENDPEIIFGYIDAMKLKSSVTLFATVDPENPIFAKTVSVKNISAGNRYLHNHNRLLWQVEGAEGVKTGFTKKAGRILVSSASRDGRRLIAVTIRDPDDWQDHKELLDRGFSDFSHKQIVREGQVLGRVSVFGGTEDYVDVIADEVFSYALMLNEVPEILLAKPDFVYAPVVEGQIAGIAYICIGEKAVGKIPVTFEATVEQTVPERKNFVERWFGGKDS